MRRVFAVAAMLVACNGSTTEPEGQISLVVSRATSERTPDHDVRIGITFVVQNRGSAPVVFRPCLTVVEHQTADAWEGRWGKSCVASGDPVVSIGANEVLVDSVVVEFDLHDGQPEWYSPPIAGTYRISVNVVDHRGALYTSAQRSSSPFSLAEPR